MFFTPFPMLALTSALQPLNAEFPIVVTLFGMLMLFSFVQPLKALSPMMAQPLLTVTDVMLIQSENTPASMSSKLELNSALVREVQLMNACPSSRRMEFSQLILLRLVQLRKAR